MGLMKSVDSFNMATTARNAQKMARAQKKALKQPPPPPPVATGVNPERVAHLEARVAYLEANLSWAIACIRELRGERQ